jgi:hypothetical protein
MFHVYCIIELVHKNPMKDYSQGRQDFRKKWDNFIKKGYKVEFTINTWYLFKHVSKLCSI